MCSTADRNRGRMDAPWGIKENAKCKMQNGNCWGEIRMSTADQPPTAEELKKALKAFRKRLKLTRLDAESSIAGGPLSKGKGAEIVAIMPPTQFPQAVWE